MKPSYIGWCLRYGRTIVGVILDPILLGDDGLSTTTTYSSTAPDPALNVHTVVASLPPTPTPTQHIITFQFLLHVFLISHNRELRAMLRARARWQRQRMAEMAVPGAQQQQQGGGSGLDALTERFLCETRTLDRDSEHLDDRLRGRRQRKKRRRGGWRGSDQNGGAGGGSMGGGGSSNNRDRAWRGGGQSMFLASFNSNEGRGGISSRDSISTAAAATTAAFIEAGAGGGGGGCRVQSYFTQALGGGSFAGTVVNKGGAT